MTIRFRTRRKLYLAILSLTVTASGGMSPFAFSQTESPQSQLPKPQVRKSEPKAERSSERTQADSQRTNVIDDRSDDETADLGIFTASCPSDALCVKQVLRHGPADEAGVEPGDYLLSLDGTAVSSPDALNKLVANLARDKEVTLKIWRQGEEIQCKVQLASKADSLPKGQDAWLGVMLSNEKEGGVKIEHIVNHSPASRSELHEGDILMKVGQADIQDTNSFLETIEEMGPEDNLQLTVRHENEVRQVAVKLGSFCDAPMAFVRHLQSQNQDSFPDGQQGQLSADASTDLMDRALDDLRNRIRELRDEVRELKASMPVNAAKPAAAKQDDISSSEAAGEALGDVRYVSRANVDAPQRRYRQQNFNRGYNSYRNNNYRSQYGQRYAPYFGYGSQTQYGGNNFYYRNNRQPYYYGGSNNWYGNRPRSGVQIGPNLGIYW